MTLTGITSVMPRCLAGGGGDDAESDAPARDAKPKKKRGLLRGVIGGALGLPG